MSKIMPNVTRPERRGNQPFLCVKTSFLSLQLLSRHDGTQAEGCWRVAESCLLIGKQQKEVRDKPSPPLVKALPPARPQLILIKHSTARDQTSKYVSLCGPFTVKPPHVHSARLHECSVLRAAEMMTQRS